MFEFSIENRSKMIKEPFWVFIPYKTPVSEESSAEVKGKVVARDVVSIFLVIDILSRPKGAVDKKPLSISSVQCFAVTRMDPNVACTNLLVWFNCSRSAALTVI